MSPGRLTRAVANAAPGEVLCLRPGDYGTFTGLAKDAMVTLRADPPRRARLRIDFDGARNLTLDGMTVRGALLEGATRDIVIRNSTFTAPTTISGLVNARVIFDRNRFNDMDVPDASSTPARIHLAYSGPAPSGVTIKRSEFAGGDADGIQSGVGVNIIGNEFRDIHGHGGTNHTDAIQLLGARGAIVRRNYIHDTDTGIVAYDGVDFARIEENVIDLTMRGARRPWAIELYSDRGSTIRHNTLRHGACEYQLPCGLIDLTNKSSQPPSQGTIVTDNVATGISLQNGATLARRGGNLLRSGAATGDLRGIPRFVGGRDPKRYLDFRLARNSPGKGAATANADPGITG